MSPKEQCLYNVRWQYLRVEMLPNWLKPLDGPMGENLNTCIKYAVEGHDRYGPRGYRTHLWRSISLLRAVNTGYLRSGLPQDDDRVLKAKSIEQWLLKAHNSPQAAGKYMVDSAWEVSTQWQMLTSEQQAKILSDLRPRLIRQPHNEPLKWFLNLVDSTPAATTATPSSTLSRA